MEELVPKKYMSIFGNLVNLGLFNWLKSKVTNPSVVKRGVPPMSPPIIHQ